MASLINRLKNKIRKGLFQLNEKINPIQVSMIIVGAQKSGTSALNYFLKQHPKVEMSNPKETDFFSTDKFWENGANYSNYNQFFKHSDITRRNVIYGEASPSYMLNSDVVAKRIFEYNPDAKLIFMLKNPIERAYSQYKMHVGRNNLAISFTEALDIALDKDYDQHIVFDEESGLSTNTIKRYIEFGEYVKQITDFKNYFKEEQMLFILNEELQNDHGNTLKSVYQFLGIPEFDIEPETIHTYKGSEMNEDEWTRLSDYFSPQFEELSKIINKDISHWSKSIVNKSE